MSFKLRPELLLHPQIPKPLHGIAPREILGKVWWDQQRLIVCRKTNWCCIVCGVHKSKAKYHKWCEVHEVYDIDYSKGTSTYVEAIPLCHSCHNFVHRGRLQALLQKGEITKAKYNYIINRGFAMIKEYKLVHPTVPAMIAPWESWRLIIDGVSYPGLTKVEWQRKFGG